MYQTKEKDHAVMVFILNRQLLTFPGSHPPSIISVWELNFCVRDGNRCSLPAIVTGYFCSLFWFISASHFLARCSRTSCTLRASLVVFLDLNQNSFANLLVLTHCCVVASSNLSHILRYAPSILIAPPCTELKSLRKPAFRKSASSEYLQN